MHHFNRRFFLHKIKLKLDKCVKILYRNITAKIEALQKHFTQWEIGGGAVEQ